MQKSTNRILSMLLALVMVFTLLPATVLADGEADVLEGWSITLGDNIGVKFYLNSADYTVTATVNGAEATPTISGNTAIVSVAAAQMTDTIGLTVKNGEETVHTGEYSVRQYAETILTGEYDQYVKDMVKEMLNYGAAAQTYFGYAGNGQANDGYELESSAEVPTEVPAITVEDNLAGISLYGMSLVFRNKTAVRFYFNVSGDIADYTFSQGTPVEKDGRYYVEIGDINPQDLANDITLNVNDGALSVTYSPLNYIVRKYNNAESSESLKALVQAMYGYHLEAVHYNAVIPVTGLANHNAGWSINPETGYGGLYIQHNAHNAAYNSDWSVEYKPVSADAIKLVRGGETFSVADPNCATLVVYSATEMYLKLEAWTITGEKLPLVDGDQLIIEGEFKHDASGDVLAIEKTVIKVANGGLGINAISVGSLGNHSGGAGGDGVHVTMADSNAAYNGDWSLEYAPLTADAYRVIREGVETNIGQPGRGTLVKFSATEGYIKHSGWCVGDFAAQTSDIFIIQGFWKDKAGSTVIQIDKTYMYHNGTTWVLAANLPTTVNAGALQTHEAGMSGNGMYIRTAANDAPFNSDWSLEYKQTSVDNIKLIRGGVTTSIGIVDRPMFVRLNETDYYLKLENWTIGDYAPITTDDVLIIEGDFFYATENVTLNITKSYVYYDGSAWVCSSSEPVFGDKCAVTGLRNHSAGWSINPENGTGGLYIQHDAHSATYNSDWSVEYKPVSADAIKLVRGGETVSVAEPTSATLVVFGATEMYLKLESWTITGDKLPLVDGDELIIEGEFKHDASGDVLAIEKTVIKVANGGLGINAISVGALGNHGGGAGGDGVHVTMTESNAAYNGDWSLEYAPLTADAYRVIREGVETNIGQPGRGTLVKFSATEGYIKHSGWCVDEFTPQTSDIFIIQGFWKHTAGSDVIQIDKTYMYHNGTTWTLATSLPTVYEAGVLQTHEAGMSGNGIYFRTAAVEAPFNGDWSLEYKQTSADNIKLIRDGVTTSVGIVDRPMFVRINETDHYLKVENWTIGDYAPITTDDVLIIEGDFHYAAENVTLNIEKSYVYYDGAAWVCSAEAPSTESIPSAGVLTANTAGGSSTNFYANGAENDAPYDWAAEYAPSSADCIKLVRNGVTYATGNTGAGTVVKFGATGYFVKFESWMNGNYPLQAGDIIIIEGIFVGTGNYAAAEGVQLSIDKTYVVYNGTSFTFSSEDPRIINVGAMYAQGGTNLNGTVGINFAVDADALPYNADWSMEYVPVSNEAIKLIRNGETKNIANTGAGTIVKLGEDNSYLKLEQWMIGDVYPITDGDVLIVEGEFKQANGDYTMVIEKTYIVIGSVANDEVTFTTHYENTDFGAVALPTSTDTLTIGMWNGSYHVFEDKQLQELKDAGITKIMGVNTQWIGTDNVNAWLDRVYSYGIRVIMDLRDWDGTTVPEYANHPGLIGFLMYDEPSANVFSDLAALKAKFDAVMPADKLFYVNLFPECAADSSLGTESSWWDQITGNTKDYDADYVTPFLNALNIEVLSWDNYSLLNGGGIRTEYFHNFEVMASKANENLPLWYTMLSAGHPTTAGNTYATPTADELRWQMAVAMTYGVQNIDHYTYVSHEDGYSCMVEYETWEPTALYYDIKNVDNEYLAWDHIFMAYDWQGVGVYDTGSTNKMLSVLENKLNLANYGLTVTTSNEDLLVGVFENNGNKAYMVTNAGSAGSATVGDGKAFTTADATVTLSLGSGSYKCVAVIDNGEISYVAVNADNTVTLNVQAYEGVFVIPVLN